ncbi:DUF1716-domain-containing protein [Polychaeton citri CBS 116435]|uniref:DUF1716-domain-containing protein n=1 Tax=Polychaeton citri CBS 116435 TaxID=1314669 RepID=A0A9P4Q6I0_9PEZI|nr:DUF1716-domain-containing protein [Polychaeton citri CBS 116435]
MATNIDDLFKSSNLTTGSLKRKLEVPDADAAYKASKLTSRSSPNGTHTNGHTATVQDEVNGEDEDDDIEAGPSLPPEDDEGDDDEEGRFFGGGVSRGQAEALDYIDEQEGEEEGFTDEKVDSAWLRRLVTSFEKKIAKNAHLRARHEGEPQRFMQSEAELDAETKSWSLLSEHPELYPEFAASEAVPALVNLLAHENTDIAIGAVEIVSELLDEDVEAGQEEWGSLVEALLEADLMDLLVSNLGRLDESEETDRSGVYHSLSVLESLSSQLGIAERIGTEKVLTYICTRASASETPISQNKQYATEVLQVMLQSSKVLRQRLATEVDGVDLFLQLLAAYRKRDPDKDSVEEEYVENLFDALTCVVDEPIGKTKFIEAEGVELVLIMLKEGSFSKIRAVRLLDHAAGGTIGAAAVCDKIVNAAGLKPIFHLFMKGKDAQTLEHLLGIFASMLRHLPGESPARIRTMAKFTEKKFEKVAKLVQLRQDYARRLATADKEIRVDQSSLDAEDVESRADEWFSRRLDGGLFCLRTIDVVLAWLCAEDAGAKTKAVELLGSLSDVKASLQDQASDLGEGQEEEETREMLATLLGYV